MIETDHVFVLAPCWSFPIYQLSLFYFLQVVVPVLPAGPVNHDSVQLGLSHDALRQRPTAVPPSSPESPSVPAGLARPGRQTGPTHLPGGEKERTLREREANFVRRELSQRAKSDELR